MCIHDGTEIKSICDRSKMEITSLTPSTTQYIASPSNRRGATWNAKPSSLADAEPVEPKSRGEDQDEAMQQSATLLGRC